MVKPPNAGTQQTGVAKTWLWAVRVSLLLGALTCVPLFADSLLFVFVLAADLVLAGFLFKRPGKSTLILCVVVGGLAFFFLGLPQALIPALGFNWGFSLAFTIAHLSVALTAAEAQGALEYSGKLPTQGTGDARWVSTVHALTVISTVPAWGVAALALAASRRGPCAEKSELHLLALLPACLPYLDILWQMRKRTRARGLGMAMAVGLGWVILVALPGLTLWDYMETLLPWLIAFGVLQFGLFVAALKTYRTLHPTQRDSRQILGGFGLLIGYALIVVVFLAIPAGALSPPRRDLNHDSAVGSMRVIKTAEITFSQLHDGNYSPSLSALGGGPQKGSAASGAQQEPLIDDELAGGTKNGYRFSYTPGVPDSAGHISSFTVTARPVTYGESGCISFFSDECGFIRSTRDDRPASAQDPPLKG